MRSASTASSWLKIASLSALAVFAACALLEHLLEARDKTAATANDTFFAVNGKQIRYRLLGAHQPGPTIVLLSGVTASLEAWDSVQTALSLRHSVLAYDRAGTGFSDASNAHDAITEADELAALLKAPDVTPDCVVVGYSASAFLARVFAARHPQLTRGVVLIDPATRDDHAATPPYQALSYRRDFARVLFMSTLQSLVGYRRLEQYWALRHIPPATPAAAKGRQILVSFHHWLASSLDCLTLDASSRQAEASPPSASIPIGLLTTSSAEHDADTYAEQRELVKTPRGILRYAGRIDHSALLWPGTDQQTLDLIFQVEQEAMLPSPH